MHLVKTALRESTRQGSESYFLGQWCEPIFLEGSNAVHPYHWRDRKKFDQDFEEIRSIYYKYVRHLAKVLNNEHSVDFSEEAWRVFIGPWLRWFVEIAFDRYSSLSEAIKSGKCSSTSILKAAKDDFVPSDFGNFMFLIGTDVWNQFLFDQIFEFLSPQGFEIGSFEVDSSSLRRQRYEGSSSLKGKLQKVASVSNLWKPRVCFTPSYLPLNFISSLFFDPKMRSFVRLSGPHRCDSPLDWNKRERLFSSSIADSEFERLLEKLVPCFVPLCYLEGFGPLFSASEKLFSKSLKVFLTGGSFNSDELLKMGVAQRKSQGDAKLIIFQHGGSFGSVKKSNLEEHQIDIADHFFSWGWERGGASNVERMPSPQLSRLKVARKGSRGPVSLVLNAMPRYSYWLFSSPFSSNFLSYLGDQKSFLDSLDAKVLAELKIRLYPLDYGWKIAQRIESWGFARQIDREPGSYLDCLQSSKVVVNTFNATTFMESMVANVPSVTFWSSEFNELREEAEEDFKKLSDVGILFSEPELAGAALGEMFEDIEGWWMSSDVQKARLQFCEKYAYHDKDWNKIWRKRLGNTLR